MIINRSLPRAEVLIEILEEVRKLGTISRASEEISNISKGGIFYMLNQENKRIVFDKSTRRYELKEETRTRKQGKRRQQ